MRAVAGLLALAVLLSGAVFPAAADGTKIIIGGGAFHRHGFFVTHPHTQIIVVPRTVFVPTYVAPSYGRWVPGYWTYQWVPQVYTSQVWVPGYYSPDGFWVEGHWELRTVQTGYYQPLWVGGYWAP